MLKKARFVTKLGVVLSYIVNLLHIGNLWKNLLAHAAGTFFNLRVNLLSQVKQGSSSTASKYRLLRNISLIPAQSMAYSEMTNKIPPNLKYET